MWRPTGIIAVSRVTRDSRDRFRLLDAVITRAADCSDIRTCPVLSTRQLPRTTNALRKTVCQTCSAFILAALPPEPGIAQEKPATTAQSTERHHRRLRLLVRSTFFRANEVTGRPATFFCHLAIRRRSGSVTERRKVIERLQQIHLQWENDHSLFSPSVGFRQETHLPTANPVDGYPLP